MEDWKVWKKVFIGQCWSRTGKKPIGGRWVDVNKGDTANPQVRSRYVAKEIATYKTDQFDAVTPQFEASRLTLSHTASGRTHGRGGRKLLIMDARKAHLHAPSKREIYVDLPPEIRKQGECGQLLRCLYGTRDASARWEEFAAGVLSRLGFAKGGSCPCVFRHKSKDLLLLIHGDDFVFSGPKPELQWMQKQMEDNFLTKVVGLLGGDEGGLKEVRVLGRVIRSRRKS